MSTPTTLTHGMRRLASVLRLGPDFQEKRGSIFMVCILYLSMFILVFRFHLMLVHKMSSFSVFSNLFKKLCKISTESLSSRKDSRVYSQWREKYSLWFMVVMLILMLIGFFSMPTYDKSQAGDKSVS